MPIEIRVNAYDLMIELKESGISRANIIKTVVSRFGVSYQTVYYWYQYNKSPLGNRKLKNNKEMFYVLGALLGDGCAYYWKKGKTYMVILVGEREFVNKFSYKLSKCTGRRIKGCFIESKNVWTLKTHNFELYLLLRELRENPNQIFDVLDEQNYWEYSLQFIEGFFDAEGCVKVIKEKCRKTPKICLDITNTNQEYLDVIKKMLKETVNIEGRYSIQKSYISKDGIRRKDSYHLRIYKKDSIRKFFDNMNTIKLKSHKISYVKNG